MSWNHLFGSKKIVLIEPLVPWLQKAWPDVQFKPASTDDPIESITILGAPHEGQSQFFIQLSLASSAHAALKRINTPDLNPDMDGLGDFDYVQFYTPLPIAAGIQNMQEMCLLIERINSKLPLIGFNLSQLDPVMVTYRHMMLIEKNRINDKLVVRTTQLIHYLINTFFPTIESLATGQKALSGIDI